MAARDRPPGSVRRRIEFDAETWHALHKLSLDHPARGKRGA
jgi:hypothetical protein